MDIQLSDKARIQKLDIASLVRKESEASQAGAAPEPGLLELCINSKKPYLNIDQIRDTHYIVYDRYRFQILSLDQSELLPKKHMTKLREIEQRVIYFNYQEEEKAMVLMTNTKALYVYCFERLEFFLENRVIPQLDAQIQISPEFQDSVHQLFKSKINSMQSGLPKFKLLNQNQNLDTRNFKNGNLFEIMWFSGKLAILSQRHGLRIFDSKHNKSTTIFEGSSSLCTQSFMYNRKYDFYLAQNIRVVHPYSDIQLQRPQFSMVQEFEIVQYYLQDLRTENQSFLTQVKSAKFSVEISEGHFEGLDNNKNPYIKEFVTCTNIESMKCVMAINLKSSFEIMMLDLRSTKKQINLRRKMDHELLTSTRGAHVFAITQNPQAGVFVISTTNHNFMCFRERDGSFIKVRSQTLLNQTIVPNRKLFLEGLFGAQGQKALTLGEVYHVKLIQAQSDRLYQFLIFEGSKIVLLDLKVSDTSPVSSHFDLVEYRERYPYQIDQNLSIFAKHELYLNIPKQMLNMLEDITKIMKLQEHGLEVTSNFNQFFFAKQILVNQFNVILSLVSQNHAFEAGVLISLMSSVLAMSKRRCLIPSQFALGSRKQTRHIYSQQIYQVQSSHGLSAQAVKTFSKSRVMHTCQMQYLSLMPILKMLLQVQANNQDDNFVMLMAQSQALADSHRQKIVKAHSMIKAYRMQGMGNGRDGVELCRRRFAELVRQLYMSDQIESILSTRKIMSIYDMTTQSAESAQPGDVEQSVQMLILKGLYGPMYGSELVQGKPWPERTNQLQASWKLFGEIYEQIQDVEYYMLVQVYSRILTQAYQSKSSNVKIKIPKLSTVIQEWRTSRFMNLDKAVQVRGQYEYRLFNLDFVRNYTPKCDTFSLHIAFLTYLGEVGELQAVMNNYQVSNRSSQCTQNLSDLLLMAKLYSEIKFYQKGYDKSLNSLFLMIMKLVLQESPQKRQQSISLKLSLSALNYLLYELAILDPLAPLMIECEHLLSRTVVKNTKSSPSAGGYISDRYPKFIVYFLQNVNNLNFHQFSEGRKTTFLPFGGNLKLINFTLEAIALYIGFNQIELDISKNQLIQTPDISQAILDSICFGEFEEKLNKRLQTNEMTQQEFDAVTQGKLRDIKTSIWKFIVLVWYLQCIYQFNNYADAKDRQDWQIRKLAVETYLKAKTKDVQNKLDQTNSLYQIYFGETEQQIHGSQKVLNFVSKAIVDSQFHKFAHKMPKILKYYAIAQKDQIYDKQQQVVESIVQAKYKQIYNQFRNVVGLKLNYTVRLVVDRSKANGKKIQLIRRIQKKWFKNAKEEVVISNLASSMSNKMLNKVDGSKSDLPPYQDQLDRSLVSNSAMSDKKKDSQKLAQQIVSTDEIQIEENEFRSPKTILDGNKVMLEQQEAHEAVNEIDHEQMQKHKAKHGAGLRSLPPQTPKIQLPKLELKDAEIQTSLEFGQLRNQQIEQYELDRTEPLKKHDLAKEEQQKEQFFDEDFIKQQLSERSPSIESEPKDEAGHPGAQEREEGISPQRLIDLQLLEIEREQKHKAMMTQAAIDQGARKLSALIWKQQFQVKFQSFMGIFKESEAKRMAQQLKLEQNKQQETISQKTWQTTDHTQTVRNTQLQLSAIPRDRDTESSISPVSQLEEQQQWLTGKRNEIRQSKTFRHTQVIDKELEKMVYYDINNRLKEQPRKLTPQRIGDRHISQKQFRTIQNESEFEMDQPSTDLNTSRFGKNEKMLRKQYRRQRVSNLEAISKNEQDFERLSGSSPSVSRSPDDKKSTISAVSDIKFLHPKEHIENLQRQKSPLRRSHSARFLRNMIQGNQKEFYKKAMPRKRNQVPTSTVTQNLIKYNQNLMLKDFNNSLRKHTSSKQQQQPKAVEPQVHLLGQQIKLLYNNYTHNKHRQAQSPMQIRRMLEQQEQQFKSKNRMIDNKPKIKLLEFKNKY